MMMIWMAIGRVNPIHMYTILKYNDEVRRALAESHAFELEAVYIYIYICVHIYIYTYTYTCKDR